MSRKILYLALGVVFVASALGAFFLPTQSGRKWATDTAVVSALGAIFQVARDSVAHERSLRILESQNAFSIGATSHMASVAFDKYSTFCEEYVAEMFSALVTLGREGPTRNVLQHADNLLTIRRKWAVWLTPRVDEGLAPFEKELRKIGANAWIHHQAPGEADNREMFSAFAKVIGLENWQGEPLTDELTVAAAIRKLRSILGTEELSRLRAELVNRALRNIRNSA